MKKKTSMQKQKIMLRGAETTIEQLTEMKF